MNDNHAQNGSAKQPDDLLAMQLTAYALGELEDREQADIERLLADPTQAEARRIVAETRQLAEVMPDAPRAAAPARSPQLREAILQKLASQPSVEPAKKTGKSRWWWMEVAAGLAAAGLLVALLWPTSPYLRQVAGKVQRQISPSFIRGSANESLAEVEVVTENTLEPEALVVVTAEPQVALDVDAAPVVVELSDFGNETAPKNDLMATIGSFRGGGVRGRGEGKPGQLASAPDGGLRVEASKRTAEGTTFFARSKEEEKEGLIPELAESTKTVTGGEGRTTHRLADLRAFRLQKESGAAESNPATNEFAFRNGYLPDPNGRGERLDDRWYDQSPGAEQYAKIIENRFLAPSEQPLSTFSIDVDTAAYANTRRFLTSGRLPPPDAVRIEELVNYFTYSYPQPKGAEPFSVNMEAAECPWQAGHLLLRVGLKGKEVPKAERPASNLVFLLDVSGSMADENKLPLVKTALSLLVGELSENDRVSIVTYAGDAGLRLPPTSGDQKRKILDAVETLQSGGSTHGSAGIQLAYEQAAQYFIKEGTNRVILATDGDLNVGITSDEALVELIKTKAAGGTFLTVLGFGEGNLKDEKMEKLADNGNGLYAYIDSVREARKVLVEQMTGSTITIAKDVKIQIEFNPAQVASYRLLGYENRVLAAQDFNDDKKDAGEIGAGHTVTALYEIVPVGAAAPAAQKQPGVDPLKYQESGVGSRESEEKKPATTKLTGAAASGELLTLKLRYKQPDGETSRLLEVPLKDRGGRFSAASKDMQFAAAVASFGMILRGSEFRGTGNLAATLEIASGSLGEDAGGYRAEFVDLVRRAQQMEVK